jgi:S-adenosylmethionine:tRNA ribosyltransferase-isomerase
MPTDFLANYDYQFPSSLIAKRPASPRDSARLLIYNRADKSIQHDSFLHLDKYLPSNAVLVLNETKVLPARLIVTKTTGGKVELLYLHHNKTHIIALANTSLTIGQVVHIDRRRTLTVTGKTGSEYSLSANFATEHILKLLQQRGLMPLPPYIKEHGLSRRQLHDKYQTVFAKQTGSVAAPTASLHFTDRLLKKLERRGITIARVTLHVGLGTFATLTPEQIANQKLHEEQYEISPAAAKVLNKAKQDGRPIIAVGTTVIRTLESAANSHGQLEKLSGGTQLFIQPGYTFKFVDHAITNFHVPKSSLMMLIAALTGREELLRVYHTAIADNYQLFSFGDGMLVL